MNDLHSNGEVLNKHKIHYNIAFNKAWCKCEVKYNRNCKTNGSHIKIKCKNDKNKTRDVDTYNEIVYLKNLETLSLKKKHVKGNTFNKENKIKDDEH